MILSYRDRYGNEHTFDNENEVCGIPGCDYKVAAITSKNQRKSKMYCENHINGVEAECVKCHKKMIMSCSDFMKIYPNTPRCKQCQLNELNRTPAMRKQACDLGRKLFKESRGMFSKESREKAMIASHTEEVLKRREETKRLNGYYDEGGGYQKVLEKRIKNGSLERWKKAGQTSEAHAKTNITRWKNMSDEEREKEIQRLRSIGFTPSFKEENDILYYYNKATKQYVPWDDYKAKFNRKRLTKDIESFINSLKSLDIFQPKNMGPVGTYDLDEIIKLYPTFRTQESDNWEGARNAFEQNLVENNIGWFVYVKFFIDPSGRIKPLVVGKSGSLNVNTNGSDVIFSTDISHGPARRFLIETKGARWDKTQILIIKAKSEKQALFYENKIANVYVLFES